MILWSTRTAAVLAENDFKRMDTSVLVISECRVKYPLPSRKWKLETNVALNNSVNKMAVQSEQSVVLQRPFLAPQDKNKLWPQSLVSVNSIGLWEVILEGNQYKWFLSVALMESGKVLDIRAVV